MRALSRSYPRVAALLLGLLPVAMFVFLVTNLVIRSMPIFAELGWFEIFTTSYLPYFTPDIGDVTMPGNFGFGPPMVGTVMVAVIAVAIALPAAMAIAVLASEFNVGVLGSLLRALSGALVGVPPIIYAALAIILVNLVMVPKFAGDSTFSEFTPETVGYTADEWPPKSIPWGPTALPWDQRGRDNSSLLAGALIALLVIPFMVPLIDDALRNVPNDMKQASMALGASRWLTLRRVTIPMSLNGIIAATALGTLKAIGDVVIVGLVVGFSSRVLPDPFYDVLGRTSSLSASSAGIIGGLSSGCVAEGCAAAFIQGFVLLVFALLVVIGSWILRARVRQRYA